MDQSDPGRRGATATAGHRTATPMAWASVVVCFGWLLLTVFTMLRAANPAVGAIDGSAQHLAVGMTLALVAAVAVTGFTRWTPAVVGWVAMSGVAVALLVFEVLQLVVPVRSFQWSDLSFGVTGSVAGAGVGVAVLTKWPGLSRLVVATAAIGLVVGVVVAVAVPPDGLDRPYRDRLADCTSSDDSGPTVDWRPAVLIPVERADGCVAAGPIALVPFGAPLADGTATSLASPQSGLQIDGGGVVSEPLPGLAKALSDGGQLTFGVRFESLVDTGDTVPVNLARLVLEGDTTRPLTQLLQRGPHLAASVGSGQPLVSAGLTLVDRAAPGTVQELVITYRGGTAQVYLDGLPIGLEQAEPFDFEPDGELVLEIGWRTDQRWEPFRGRVEAVVITDRVVGQDQLPELFKQP